MCIRRTVEYSFGTRTRLPLHIIWPALSPFTPTYQTLNGATNIEQSEWIATNACSEMSQRIVSNRNSRIYPIQLNEARHKPDGQHFWEETSFYLRMSSHTKCHAVSSISPSRRHWHLIILAPTANGSVPFLGNWGFFLQHFRLLYPIHTTDVDASRLNYRLASRRCRRSEFDQLLWSLNVSSVWYLSQMNLKITCYVYVSSATV